MNSYQHHSSILRCIWGNMLSCTRNSWGMCLHNSNTNSFEQTYHICMQQSRYLCQSYRYWKYILPLHSISNGFYIPCNSHRDSWEYNLVFVWCNYCWTNQSRLNIFDSFRMKCIANNFIYRSYIGWDRLKDFKGSSQENIWYSMKV